MVTSRSHTPTPGAGRNPPHLEAIVARPHPHAKGSEPICHCFDPVRFLDAELTGAADPARPAGEGGRERELRELVHESRHFLRGDFRADELRRPDLEISD